jgi:choice-of-anchor C domain-containing protein
MRLLKFVCMLVVFGALAAHASPVFSDSFAGASGSYTTLSSGTLFPSSTLGPWTVSSGTIDWIGTYWNPYDVDSGSVDLNGTSPGAIQATLSGMTPGTTYYVAFYMSGNPDGFNGTQGARGEMSLIAAINGDTFGSFTFDTNVVGNTLADMKWALRTFEFTATGATATLTFTSNNTGPWGPALDNVWVDTPEPGALALLGGGLVALGFVARRRRKRT